MPPAAPVGIESEVSSHLTEQWQKQPSPIRIPFGEGREITFDVVYDNFCIPLGCRCRCVIFPAVEKLTFSSSVRPKKLIGTYKHKKEIMNTVGGQFQEKFVTFGFPSGNMRYLIHDKESQQILLSLHEYEPIFKIKKHKELSAKHKEPVYTLGLHSQNQILEPHLVMSIFKLVATAVQRLETMGTCHSTIPHFLKYEKKEEFPAPDFTLRTCPLGNLPWVQATSAPHK